VRRADLADVSLIDQVTDVAGARGETALQPDDVPDSFRLGQSQDFLRLGGAGRQRGVLTAVCSALPGPSPADRKAVNVGDRLTTSDQRRRHIHPHLPAVMTRSETTPRQRRRQAVGQADPTCQQPDRDRPRH
jgi:hypothetical protein